MLKETYAVYYMSDIYGLSQCYYFLHLTFIQVSKGLYCIVSDIFTALYQGNAGVSGMASNTSPVSGMMHMNMGMSGITQQPAQQSAAPAGNT